MSEWEDIIITGRDKSRSHTPQPNDTELQAQIFILSAVPPQHWLNTFNAAAIASPGREGRITHTRANLLIVSGGPNTFDKRDADHLKTLVAYSNDEYRDSLQAMDVSGLDAFG